MGACPVQSGDDVGDGLANTWNFPQPAFGYDAVERFGERRQALRGARR
jgi:hypothetical protein